MSTSPHHITNVRLYVSVDPGHGGPMSEYRIDPAKDGYTVTLRISRLVLGLPELDRQPVPPPRALSPLARWFKPSVEAAKERVKPSHMTEVLVKDQQQVEEFLAKLSTEFKVYELTDLKPPYPFLHPTFYSFSFGDAAGKNHSFEYQIECSNHLDERYAALIQEFNGFFESRRVFDAFFKSQQ